MFLYDLSNTIVCSIGSALTKHPVASQITVTTHRLASISYLPRRDRWSPPLWPGIYCLHTEHLGVFTQGVPDAMALDWIACPWFPDAPLGNTTTGNHHRHDSRKTYCAFGSPRLIYIRFGNLPRCTKCISRSNRMGGSKNEKC